MCILKKAIAEFKRIKTIHFIITFQELYLENNLIEEISDTVLNKTTNLNVISLRHNRLDESRIAPLAWIDHK